MKVSYVNHMGSDLTVCNSARISFGQASQELTDRDVKLINYLAKHSHFSCFEHCVMSVHIKCPLFIRSQIMRHRSFAFNEQSRRYTSENIEFYTPDTWKQQAKDNRQSSSDAVSELDSHIADSDYARALTQCLESYDEMLRHGVSREQARMVLPQSTYTQFIMTGNLRNWHHFIALRSHKGAQEEAQWIAGEVQKILTEHFPVSMRALTEASSEHT